MGPKHDRRAQIGTDARTWGVSPRAEDNRLVHRRAVVATFAGLPVPARLIGHTIEARLFADVVEVRYRGQVVQTIHTYQTSAGPSLEAHFSDPNFGDVRMIVTGRAGEIVQAQLVVRDRVAADAINTAAARMHAAGDGLHLGKFRHL